MLRQTLAYSPPEHIHITLCIGPGTILLRNKILAAVLLVVQLGKHPHAAINLSMRCSCCLATVP